MIDKTKIHLTRKGLIWSDLNFMDNFCKKPDSGLGLGSSEQISIALLCARAASLLGSTLRGSASTNLCKLKKGHTYLKNLKTTIVIPVELIFLGPWKSSKTSLKIFIWKNVEALGFMTKFLLWWYNSAKFCGGPAGMCDGPALAFIWRTQSTAVCRFKICCGSTTQFAKLV